MLRKLAPAGLLLLVALAACGTQAPALTDPKEIITQGMQATGDAKSLHVDLAVTGTITIPDTDGTFNLEGTTAGGDLDIANDKARVTFSAPALLGLSGEAIQIGSDSYVKSSLTGAKYVKSTVEDTDVSLDPDEAITQVEAFLDKDGVETEKLADVACGDRTCYAVKVTIPASLLADAGTATGIDPGQFLGEGLVLTIQFDRQDLRLRQVSTDIDAGDLGSFGVVATFSAYDEAVDVSPPPDDQVTTEDGGPIP